MSTSAIIPQSPRQDQRPEEPSLAGLLQLSNNNDIQAIDLLVQRYIANGSDSEAGEWLEKKAEIVKSGDTFFNAGDFYYQLNTPAADQKCMQLYKRACILWAQELIDRTPNMAAERPIPAPPMLQPHERDQLIESLHDELAVAHGNSAKMVEIMDQLVALRDPNAETLYGQWLWDGEHGLQEDQKSGLAYWMRGMEKDVAEAFCFMHVVYYGLEETPQNSLRGKIFLKMGADLGDVEAKFEHGCTLIECADEENPLGFEEGAKYIRAAREAQCQSAIDYKLPDEQ